MPSHLFTLVLANQEVSVDAASLVRYAEGPGTSRTIARFDARAMEWKESLSIDDVRLTRQIKSRISEGEAAWFVERGRTAPWGEVSPADSLSAADPNDPRVDSCYRRADRLYRHFSEPGRRGVAMGKLSKVLYLMRPRVVPIIDSRLARLYRHRAREVAHQLNLGSRYNYWEAVRLDLVDPRTLAALAAIRDWAAAGSASVSHLGKLTDIRILDLIAWAGTQVPLP